MTPKNGFFLLAHEVFGRKRFLRWKFIGLFQLLCSVDRLASVPSERLANQIPRDAAQPGSQSCRLAKFRQVDPRSHECLLRDILALVRLPVAL